MSGSRYCEFCGAGTQPGDKFCGACGRPLEDDAPVSSRCPNGCATPDADARFCFLCGARLLDESAEPAAAEERFPGPLPAAPIPIPRYRPVIDMEALLADADPEPQPRPVLPLEAPAVPDTPVPQLFPADAAQPEEAERPRPVLDPPPGPGETVSFGFADAPGAAAMTVNSLDDLLAASHLPASDAMPDAAFPERERQTGPKEPPPAF